MPAIIVTSNTTCGSARYYRVQLQRRKSCTILGTKWSVFQNIKCALKANIGSKFSHAIFRSRKMDTILFRIYSPRSSESKMDIRHVNKVANIESLLAFSFAVRKRSRRCSVARAAPKEIFYNRDTFTWSKYSIHLYSMFLIEYRKAFITRNPYQAYCMVDGRHRNHLYSFNPLNLSRSYRICGCLTFCSPGCQYIHNDSLNTAEPSTVL